MNVILKRLVIMSVIHKRRNITWNKIALHPMNSIRISLIFILRRGQTSFNFHSSRFKYMHYIYQSQTLPQFNIFSVLLISTISL
jgi:hypothetical protein